MSDTEESFDVIVVGSGGGGLIGAYTAASKGLRTLLIEKTDKVGGTTAYSGAGLWFPGSAPVRRAGISDDDVDAAREYLRAAVDDPSRETLQDAYITTAARVIDELEQNPRFGEFTHMPVPDYYAGLPGATPHGRTVFPEPVSVADLGDHAQLVRRSIYTERYGHTEDDVLLGGRAFVARALVAFLETGSGNLETETELVELLLEDDRVVGIVARRRGERITCRADRGVLLAAGGFEHNDELRAKYGAIPSSGDWSDGVDSNTGDALLAGIAAGADTDLMDEAWYIPGVVQRDGKPVFNHASRSGIWVNGAGRRFTNEAAPYDQAGHAIRDGERETDVDHTPTWWVFDHKHLMRDGFGATEPGLDLDPSWLESGAVVRADTLDELAGKIGVPAQALSESVATFNGYVETGVDEEFHRGETAWDQMCQFIVGYPALPQQNFIVPITPEGPNPLITAIDTGPYYASKLLLSDLGTKGGLKTDASARVLRADGSPIRGLYAAGNTMAAMSGHVYPGAGTPIGSSVVFGFLAACDLVGAAV